MDVGSSRSGPIYTPVYHSVPASDVLQHHSRQPDATLYLWADSSLRDVSDLLWGAGGPLHNTATLSLGLLYPDRTGTQKFRRIGGVHRHQKGPDDIISLYSAGFQAGDALAVTFVEAGSPRDQLKRAEEGGTAHDEGGVGDT